MKRYFLIGLALVLLLALSAIFYGAWLNEQGEYKIAERMEERRLTLSGVKAETRELHPRITLSTVSLTASAKTDAVALIDGRITECLAPKGSFVHKGDVIFIIENEDIPLQIKEADAAILQAEAELKRATNNFSRYRLLRENDAISAERYDEAETAYTAAVANLDAATARKEKLLVQSARREVTAPIDGTVLTLYREIGAYVANGTPLALVGDFGMLSFASPLEDRYARRLAIGDEAQLLFRRKDLQKVYGTEYAAGNMGMSQEFIAHLAEITPPLSEPAAMRSVTWQVDNSAGILEPQTYGGVSLSARKGYSVLAVPLSAMTDSTRSAVFVLRDNGTVSRRIVETGASDGEYIGILSGLSEGEIVVTSGTEGLADGMKVEIELNETSAGGAAK